MESGGQAFGKLILVGEHAVVYGIPAIALGIHRGATARARPLASARGPSRLRIATWSTEVTEDDERDLGRALAAMLSSVRSRGSLPPVEIDAETSLPAGGGLGCSAALGVAIARAVVGLSSSGAAISDDVSDHAMAWEKVFHGNPSGVDAAVAALGGAIAFRRADLGSIIEPIVARAPLAIAIGHSGTASSTRSMVESVAHQRTVRPGVVDEAFEGIRAVVSKARVAIETGDRMALGKLLDMNQTLLAKLSLCTPKIEELCTTAREAGALGAKLTGAGGGGCVLALADSHAGAARILSSWRARSFEGLITELRPPTRDAHSDVAFAT